MVSRAVHRDRSHAEKRVEGLKSTASSNQVIRNQLFDAHQIVCKSLPLWFYCVAQSFEQGCR